MGDIKIRTVFWINRNGNEISNPSINSHIGLAQYFLENSQVLRTQYENRKNKGQNIMDFLISVKGLMKGSQFGEYKNITYDSRTLSDEQRMALREYHDQEYRLDDLYINELRKKRESQYK